MGYTVMLCYCYEAGIELYFVWHPCSDSIAMLLHLINCRFIIIIIIIIIIEATQTVLMILVLIIVTKQPLQNITDSDRRC